MHFSYQTGIFPFFALPAAPCAGQFGFFSRGFFPNFDDAGAPKYVAELAYWESKSHKGDWMTKELQPKQFQDAVKLAGFVHP